MLFEFFSGIHFNAKERILLNENISQKIIIDPLPVILKDNLHVNIFTKNAISQNHNDFKGEKYHFAKT